MTRIMFPFLLFVSIAALFMGIHNSLKSFFVPALNTAFYNLTVILCVVFVAGHLSEPLLALAIGVVLGGVMQGLIQVPYLVKKQFYPALTVNFAHEGLKRILILVLPTVAGLGVVQINIFVSTFFVSFLPDGSATYLFYAMRLIHFPVGMFGVAMATAVLPSLSRQSVQGRMDDFKNTFSFSLRLLFFLTIPAMAGLFAISEPLVHVLFERGRFDSADTIGTVIALQYYAAGLWAFVGVRVVASAFYSVQDTKTPVKVAALSITANIVFSMLLMGPLQHGGLALANSIGSAINFTILFIALQKKFGHLGTRKIINSIIKISIASLVMAVTGYGLLQGPLWQDTHHLLQKAAILGFTITICVAIYLLLLSLMKSEELTYMTGFIKRRRAKK
jgi:putative peptidoglycan lipid II flippase